MQVPKNNFFNKLNLHILQNFSGSDSLLNCLNIFESFEQLLESDFFSYLLRGVDLLESTNRRPEK